MIFLFVVPDTHTRKHITLLIFASETDDKCFVPSPRLDAEHQFALFHKFLVTPYIELGLMLNMDNSHMYIAAPQAPQQLVVPLIKLTDIYVFSASQHHS